jgi:hypothetical protein
MGKATRCSCIEGSRVSAHVLWFGRQKGDEGIVIVKKLGTGSALVKKWVYNCRKK